MNSTKRVTSTGHLRETCPDALSFFFLLCVAEHDTLSVQELLRSVFFFSLVSGGHMAMPKFPVKAELQRTVELMNLTSVACSFRGTSCFSVLPLDCLLVASVAHKHVYTCIYIYENNGTVVGV